MDVLPQFAAAERWRGLAVSTVAKRVNLVARWVAHVGDPFDPTLDHRDVEAWVGASNMRAARSRLRHWCGTRVYAASSDLGVVQDYLGHASPVTTRIYARMEPARLATVAAGLELPGGAR